MASTKYAKYLKSEHWQELKKRRATRKCWCCRRKIAKPQIHHKTYERLGQELNRDLVSVCAHCHLEIHTLVKEGKCKLLFAHKAVKKIFFEYKYLMQLCYGVFKEDYGILIDFLEKAGYLKDKEPTSLAKFEGLVWEHGKTWIWHKYKVLKLFKESNPEYTWVDLYRAKEYTKPLKRMRLERQIQRYIDEDTFVSQII